MVIRTNLTSSPELSLVASVLGDRDIAQFGRQVAVGLQRNSTSWLHHNLASVYWRIRGDAPNAIECARKAVHFAPRYKKVYYILKNILKYENIHSTFFLHDFIISYSSAPEMILLLSNTCPRMVFLGFSLNCINITCRLYMKMRQSVNLIHFNPLLPEGTYKSCII